ncbi:hypothetical protein DRP77_05345, partial [Candidatus Poribacteria bacterium]
MIAVNNSRCSPDLQLFLYTDMKLYLIRVPGILKANRWYHIAAAFDGKLMRLYLNGVLVGERAYEGDLSAILKEGENLLGKAHWRENEDFKGQLDEIRIWGVARTGEQIRSTMFRKLRGDEPGLVGLWNFDSGDAKDSSPNGYDGMLIGNARCVEAELPSEGELPRPAVISGIVRAPSGKALVGAKLRLERNGRTAAEAVTDEEGNYHFVIFPEEGVYDLSAKWEDMGCWRLNLRLRPGESRRLNLTLKTAISITGTTLAWDNSPLAGVTVQALRGDGEAEKVVATTLSDENGRYEFVNLMPGRYKVRCYKPGGYVYYSPQGSGEGLLDVKPGRTVRGVDFHLAPFKKGVWKSHTYLDGLANNRVYAIQGDSTGAIWFGTENGLSRYDGESFANFSTKDGLAGDWVTCIYKGKGGVLWIGTRNGLSKYENGRFISFDEEDGLISNDIRAICQDDEGRLWIGTRDGLSIYDGEKFINLTVENGLPHNSIRAICRDA